MHNKEEVGSNYSQLFTLNSQLSTKKLKKLTTEIWTQFAQYLLLMAWEV